MKILVTRPEPGATATAARLAQMGLTPVLLPCLRMITLEARLPARPQAVVVTSGQVIGMLPEGYRKLPCFCVGDATAARLRAAGFTWVESAAGDAQDLARLLAARRVPGLHVLVVGRGHGLGLAAELRVAGLRVMRRCVYAARAVRAMPDAVRSALAAGEIAAALFYSAETASAFAGLRPPGTAGIEALALSPAVATALQGLPWKSIRVAVAPAEADLLAYLDDRVKDERD